MMNDQELLEALKEEYAKKFKYETNMQKKGMITKKYMKSIRNAEARIKRAEG